MRDQRQGMTFAAQAAADGSFAGANGGKAQTAQSDLQFFSNAVRIAGWAVDSQEGKSLINGVLGV